jgi:hypothetical protein
MGKVTSEMSITPGWFYRPPNDDVTMPTGECADRLHRWIYVTTQLLRRTYAIR